MGIMKMFDEPDKSYNSKDGKTAETKWVKTYSAKMNMPYKVSVVEKVNLKKLIQEFDLTNTMKVIEYYINNYESISYIKGFPSINAMYGFRRTLFPEVLHKSEINFDFNIIKEEQSNGSEEKTSSQTSKKRLW